MASTYRSHGGPLGKPFFFQGDGSRFDFFQAVRLAEKLRPEARPVGESRTGATESIRFSSRVGLEFPSNDVNEIEGGFQETLYILSEATLNKIELSLGRDIRLLLNIIEDQEYHSAGELRAVLQGIMPPALFDANAAFIVAVARRLSPVEMNINFLGLAGAHGPLPLAYTELLLDRLRFRDTGMRDFLDIFNHRLASLMYRVRKVHRPGFSLAAPEHDTLSENLSALMGIALPGVAFTKCIPWRKLLYYAGLFASRSRSVDGLECLLRHYFQAPVRVESGRAQWLEIEPEERTALGQLRTMLGDSADQASLGRGFWSADTRIRVHIGPLSHGKYETLLPGQPACDELRELIGLYAGPEIDFDIRLILKYEDAQATVLRLPVADGDPPARRPRLGLTSFLKTGVHRTAFCLTQRFFERLKDPAAPKYCDLESELAAAPALLSFLESELRGVKHSSGFLLRAALRRKCAAYFRIEFKRYARTHTTSGGLHYILDTAFFDRIQSGLPGLTGIIASARRIYEDRPISDPTDFRYFMADQFVERFNDVFARCARKSAEGLSETYRVPLKFFRDLRLLLPGYVDVLDRTRERLDRTQQVSRTECLELLQNSIGRDRGDIYRDYLRAVRLREEAALRDVVEHREDRPLFEDAEKRYGAYGFALEILRQDTPDFTDDAESFLKALTHTLQRVDTTRQLMIAEIRADVMESLRELRPSRNFFIALENEYPEAVFLLDDLRVALQDRFFQQRSQFIDAVREFLRNWRLSSSEMYFLDRARLSGEYGLPLEFFRLLRDRSRGATAAMPARAVLREMRRAMGPEFERFTAGYRSQMRDRERGLFANLSPIQPQGEILNQAWINFQTARARGRADRAQESLRTLPHLRHLRRTVRPVRGVDERLRARLSHTFSGGRAIFPGYTYHSLREIWRRLRLRGNLLRRFAESLPSLEYFAQRLGARINARSMDTPAAFRVALKNRAGIGGSLYDETYRDYLREHTSESEENRRVFLRAFHILRAEFPEPHDAVELAFEEFDRHPALYATPEAMSAGLSAILTNADTLHRLVLLRQLRRRLPEWEVLQSRAGRVLADFEHLAPDTAVLAQEARRRMEDYAFQNRFTYQEVLRSVLGPAVKSLGYRSFFIEKARQQLQPVRRLYRLDARDLRRLALRAGNVRLELPLTGLRQIQGREFESREQLEAQLVTPARSESLSRAARLLIAEAAERTDFRQKPEFYYIGVTCLRRLRVHVPAYLLGAPLRPMMNRLYSSRCYFLEALTALIGDYNTIVYESYFLEHARVAYSGQPRYLLNAAFERRLHDAVKTRETKRSVIRQARAVPYMEYLDGEEIWHELSAQLPTKRRNDPGLRWRVIQASLAAEREIAVIVPGSVGHRQEN